MQKKRPLKLHIKYHAVNIQIFIQKKVAPADNGPYASRDKRIAYSHRLHTWDWQSSFVLKKYNEYVCDYVHKATLFKGR